MADAVFNTLNDWECVDDTASNTGDWRGACILLERQVGKRLLRLACRRHVYEIMLRTAYESEFGSSSAPTIPFFTRFKKAWKDIDKSKYENGIQDQFVREALEDVIDDITDFCKNELQEDFARQDYKELLELTLIFLGTYDGEITFHDPKAMHHARWMAKALYALKMYLFRAIYHLTKNEEEALRNFCIFIVRFYVKAWTRCANVLEAPNQDLNFLKGVRKFAETNEKMSEVVLNKFRTHLWYLAAEPIAFAVFDDNVSLQQKRDLARTLLSQPEPDESTYITRLIFSPSQITSICDWQLHHFITENTIKLFSRYEINTEFLNKEPTEWPYDDGYNHGKNILSHLKVANDNAERGVKLMEDFNRYFTHDEETKQYALQVVADYRQKYPSNTKSSLKE